jgi:hypothetical protein
MPTVATGENNFDPHLSPTFPPALSGIGEADAFLLPSRQDSLTVEIDGIAYALYGGELCRRGGAPSHADHFQIGCI